MGGGGLRFRVFSSNFRGCAFSRLGSSVFVFVTTAISCSVSLDVNTRRIAHRHDNLDQTTQLRTKLKVSKRYPS